MPMILIILATTILIGCGSYKGNEIWRRSTCDNIADADERAQCLEEATRPESEYKREIESVTGE